MDKVRSQVLEMCRIGFDLVLTNTLLKDNILKDKMNHDNDSTTWEDEMKKMKQWVGCSHESPEVRMVDENREMTYHDNSCKDLDLARP